MPRDAAEWCALASGVCFALATVYIRKSHDVGALEKTFANQLFSIPFALLLLLILPAPTPTAAALLSALPLILLTRNSSFARTRGLRAVEERTHLVLPAARAQRDLDRCDERVHRDGTLEDRHVELPQVLRRRHDLLLAPALGREDDREDRTTSPAHRGCARACRAARSARALLPRDECARAFRRKRRARRAELRELDRLEVLTPQHLGRHFSVTAVRSDDEDALGFERHLRPREEVVSAARELRRTARTPRNSVSGAPISNPFAPIVNSRIVFSCAELRCFWIEIALCTAPFARSSASARRCPRGTRRRSATRACRRSRERRDEKRERVALREEREELVQENLEETLLRHRVDVTIQAVDRDEARPALDSSRTLATNSPGVSSAGSTSWSTSLPDAMCGRGSARARCCA